MKKSFVKILVLTLLLSGTAGAVFAWGGSDPVSSYENDTTPAAAITEVEASHILVRDAADAVKIKKEIENGGSFEYYAQRYSLCPSGKNGGYLGYFKRGQMVPEFEKKAFSMNVGEISSPVRTNFGWHIIKITDKR